jgi:hypothetical protein
MVWLRRLKRVLGVRKVALREKDAKGVQEAEAIAIDADVAVVDADPAAAVRAEVTVVATRAVAAEDAEDGRISSQ